MYYIAINGLISSKKKRGGLRILGDAVRLDETPGAVRAGVIPLPICP